MGVSTTSRGANCQLEAAKRVYHYVHGICSIEVCRGFNRQRLEDEGTKRTTIQVLNIIQKVPQPVIHPESR